MTDLRRRAVLRAVGAAGAVGTAGALGAAGAALAGHGDDGGEFPARQPERDPPRAYEEYTVRRVPGDHVSVQAAVDAAEPRDLVLVEPGVYREAVEVTTPRVTIRGTDRNRVILDGEFERPNGVQATADDVVVENVTARRYRQNGFFWVSVSGFRASYVTAYNNRLYGVYAIDSEHGTFEHSYASGHTDSGFYLGECKPCHAVVRDVRAENNAIGYSGTNAGGYLTIRDSVWRANMGGIVPNSLDSEANPPQTAAYIAGNEVYANNNADAPDSEFGYAAFGTGINVAGGVHNEVVDNAVEDHANYGIVLTPMIDENLYAPRGNRVAGNRVRSSGRADLAAGVPLDGGNRFVDNDARTSRPAGLNGGFGYAGGDPAVTMVLLEQFIQLDSGGSPRGNWRRAPEPPFEEFEAMSEAATAPPREAVRRGQ